MIGVRDLTPLSPADLPALLPGETFTDPIFGTAGRYLGHGYHAYSSSTYRPWSCDGRWLILADSGFVPVLSRFDAEKTGEVVTVGPLFEGAVDVTAAQVEWTSIVWDPVNPDVCYALETGERGPAKRCRIWRVDVSRVGAVRFSVVRRFKELEIRGASVYQHSRSRDGKIWALHAVTPAGTYACTWDVGADRLTVLEEFSDVNECVISPDGDVLRIMHANEDVTVVRQRSGAVYNLPTTDPDAGVVEHVDWFNNKMYGGRKLDNALVARDLRAPVSTIDQILAIPWCAGGGWHVSCCRDFVIVSTYGLGAGGVFQNEIIQVYSSGDFTRLAHTQSFTAPYAGGASYWNQPRAVVSSDGRWVLSSGGDARLFLFRVPPSAEVQRLQAELAEADSDAEQVDRVLDKIMTARDAALAKLTDVRELLDAIRAILS